MSLEHSPGRVAYSIAGFCEAHSISRALLYKAWKDGWGPDRMECAGKPLISVESASRWRKWREQVSAEQAKVAQAEAAA